MISTYIPNQIDQIIEIEPEGTQMTYKQFIKNIEQRLVDQGDKPKSERLRYGQIIMMELWEIWPQKYHQIAGSDKDPFYSDILHKKPHDLLNELALEWPVVPDKRDEKNYSIPSPEQIRIQRLEKKIKKLQNSNKKYRENLKFYQKLTRNFPWVAKDYEARRENEILKDKLSLQTWTVRGLKGELEYLDHSITDDMMRVFEQLSIHIGDSYTEIDGKTITGKDLINKIASVIKNIKKHINYQLISNKRENNEN